MPTQQTALSPEFNEAPLKESIVYQIYSKYEINCGHIGIASIKDILFKNIGTEQLTESLKDSIIQTLATMQAVKMTRDQNSQLSLTFLSNTIEGKTAIIPIGDEVARSVVEGGIEYFLNPLSRNMTERLKLAITNRIAEIEGELSESSMTFLEAIDVQVYRISKSFYGTASLRQKKILALLDLKSEIVSNVLLPLSQIINDWKGTYSFEDRKTSYEPTSAHRDDELTYVFSTWGRERKTNYELISTQRLEIPSRLSFLNPENTRSEPRSKQCIDKYYKIAVAVENGFDTPFEEKANERGYQKLMTPN